MRQLKLGFLFTIVSYFLNICAAISGAIFGILSIAILFFALSVNAAVVKPGSEPFADDNFVVFLENMTYITNAGHLDAQGLTKGGAAFEPWSGSYWPIHKGIIAARYSSSTFANAKRFINNYQSYQAHPPQGFVNSGRIRELSPAEKYDLLIGDSNWTLSRFIWAKALEDFQQDGIVAGWTGICHGWAAATHMNPMSPYSPVTVSDVYGGHSIQFHANDIKGLMSWLWAESAPNSYRSGNRCRQGRIERDPYLRPVNPTCLDTNPMSWHLAITNKVGLNKKSMAMDSSNGPEVWNYPITGYDYSYFDPKTFAPTHSFNKAVRSITTLPSDPYRAFRSPKTKFIVGIVMDTYHPALTVPTTGVTSVVKTTKKTFIYDLELDESYNIVGGEWYGKETPDFIWSFSEGSKAHSREDVRLASKEITWDAKTQRIPEEVAAQAREASKRGEVLAIVTEALLQASTQKIEHSEDDVAEEENIDEDNEGNNSIEEPTPQDPLPEPQPEAPQNPENVP